MTEKPHSVTDKSKERLNLSSRFSDRISREHIQSRYEDLIDFLPIIIYIVEPHPPYAPIYVSKGIEMLGYTQEDWRTTPGLWLSRLYEDDRERVLRETRKAFAEKGETDYEYRFYARDDSIFWFQDKGRFVYDEDGKPFSREGFLLNITERKLFETDRENAAKISAAGFESKRKKILLVEDEEIIRDMMREILLSDDYDVTTARNGAEALELCRTSEKDFHLVITDFNMPGMNGRELAKKIKAICGSTDVLFMSGYTDDEEFLQEISHNDKLFIAKPFSPETLMSKVKAIFEKD